MHFNFWGEQPHFLGPIYVLLFHDNQSLLYFETDNQFDFVIFTLRNHYIKNVYMRKKKQTSIAQSAGAVKYTDCTFAEE